MSNKKRSLIIILIIFLVVAVILVGLFSYKWWQAKKEIEAKRRTSFVQCGEIKVSRKDILNIYLLGAFIPPKEGEKHMWDLFVINPEGDIIGSGYPLELSDMWQFSPIDKNEDGIMDRVIGTGDRKIGDYLIMVIPQQDIFPSNTYSLRLGNLFLAENVPFSTNLLDRLYILRQTEDGIIPFVPASVGCRY